MDKVLIGLVNRGGKAKEAKALVRSEDLFSFPTAILAALEVEQEDVSMMCEATNTDGTGELAPRWRAGALHHGCAIFARAKHVTQIETLARGEEQAQGKISRYIIYKIHFEGTILGTGLRNLSICVAHLNNEHAKNSPLLCATFNSRMGADIVKHQVRFCCVDYNMRAFELKEKLEKQIHSEQPMDRRAAGPVAFRDGLLVTVAAHHTSFKKNHFVGGIQQWSGEIVFDSCLILAIGSHNGVRRKSDMHHALAGACWPQTLNNAGDQTKELRPGFPKDRYRVVQKIKCTQQKSLAAFCCCGNHALT